MRLVYLDECEIHRHPHLAKMWQRRGCPVKIPAAGEDRTFAVFGALDYATGQIIWQLSPQKDGTAFVVFLDHLVATLPAGPLVIVLDNVGYHKGRLAKNWWMPSRPSASPVAAGIRPTGEPDGTCLGLRQSQAQLPSLVGRWTRARTRHSTPAVAPPGTVPPA